VSQPCFTQTDDPDVLKMKRGGGYLSASGLPFLLAGLFVLQIPLDVVPVHLEEGPIILALIMPLGLAFTIAGAALVLVRNGITIDRRNRTITQWWGLLAPMKRTEYSLDSFGSVRLDLHAGDRDSGDACTINLIGSGRSAPFYIPSPGDYDGTRRTAEQLSHFLGIPFEDTVAEEPEDNN
jgi:hypothetical protein